MPEGKRVENTSATGSKPAEASSVELVPGGSGVLAPGPEGGGVLAPGPWGGWVLVPGGVRAPVGTTTPPSILLEISLELARISRELASIWLSLPERAAACLGLRPGSGSGLGTA